jgi:hypothetical protein
MDAEMWDALVAQFEAGLDPHLYPPTHPKGPRAMTQVPEQRCPGGAEHGAHQWNVYDPTGVKLTRVNPDGLRICPGYTNPTLQQIREQMAVYMRPHLPVTRDLPARAVKYLDGGPTRYSKNAST